MNFQQFKQAGKRDVPNLIAAQNADDRLQQQIDQIKMQNIGSTIKGGGELYNEAMGDKTPIADYLFGTEPSGQFAMDKIGYALPEAAGSSSGLNSAALTEALRAPATELTANGMNLGTALAPEATALDLTANGMNLGTALAPEAVAAGTAGETALAASLGELGLAGTAGETALAASLGELGLAGTTGALAGTTGALAGTTGALAGTAATGAGVAGATAAGAAIPPLGIALLIAGLLGPEMFG